MAQGTLPLDETVQYGGSETCFVVESNSTTQAQDTEIKSRDKAHPKLTRAERILLRLRQGPATGIELLQAGGGTRYGARLLELRRAGHAIETDMSGEWPTYTLIAERL